MDEVKETAAAQAALRPLAEASASGAVTLASQVHEMRELRDQLDAARVLLARRVELWDADALAPKWAATASWLHPKDKSTAQLLERRRITYKRAEQLLRATPSSLRALPDRATKLEVLQARCAAVQAATIAPTILMAEEIAVADDLAALALVVATSRPAHGHADSRGLGRTSDRESHLSGSYSAVSGAAASE